MLVRGALLEQSRQQRTCSAGQCFLCLWRVASSATVSSAGWSPESRRLAKATCGATHMFYMSCGGLPLGSEVFGWSGQPLKMSKRTRLEGDVLLLSVGSGTSLQQARLPLPVGQRLPQKDAQHTLQRHTCA